jgi:hypothetical protein
MTRKSKILLAVSISAFALGCTGIFWGVGTPLGAVFFGLFLISKVLEKETALFDAEQQACARLAESRTVSTLKDKCVPNCCEGRGGLNPAIQTH